MEPALEVRADGWANTCPACALRAVLGTNPFGLAGLSNLALGAVKFVVAARGPTLRPAITLEKLGGMRPPGIYAGDPTALPTRIVGFEELPVGTAGAVTGCQPAGGLAITGLAAKLL
jgi:hypothetical protein